MREFDLLRRVSAPNLDHAQIKTTINFGLDWGLVLKLAEAHGVRAQLIGALQRLDWVDVPPDAKSALLEFLRFHKLRSLHLTDQLIQVADRFSKRGLRFATFKGPSLAAAVYGDLSRRECNDIDLIVDEKHLAEAETVLESMGFQPVHGSSMFRAAFLSYQRQFMWVRTDPDVTIDLHWDFTPAQVPFPLTPREIWSNLAAVELGGRPVPTLGRDELALFLAGHGTKEGWRCLGWVCDFAMLIERYPDLDWAQLLTRARRNACGRPLLLGCLLVARLFETRVEDRMLELADADAEVRLAADRIVWQLVNEFPAPSTGRFLSDLELCETRGQKARILGRHLVTRTVGDYASMPLPPSLWGAYHVTRPFRLGFRALSNAFK